MKLEGVDFCHQALFCVLTVAELCGYRIRLHFDGYSECYDFWTDIDSPYIFPVGFCEKNGKILQPPKGNNYIQLNNHTVHNFFQSSIPSLKSVYIQISWLLMKTADQQLHCFHPHHESVLIMKLHLWIHWSRKSSYV